ncbi:unnamed protein product, partial [marine sediment metagenome]
MPDEGFKRPVRIFASVVFPEPFGPTIARKSPSYTEIYTQILVPVVPFYTYADNINWNDIKLYWQGETGALDYLTNN